MSVCLAEKWSLRVGASQWPWVLRRCSDWHRRVRGQGKSATLSWEGQVCWASAAVVKSLPRGLSSLHRIAAAMFGAGISSTTQSAFSGGGGGAVGGSSLFAGGTSAAATSGSSFLFGGNCASKRSAPAQGAAAGSLFGNAATASQALPQTPAASATTTAAGSSLLGTAGNAALGGGLLLNPNESLANIFAAVDVRAASLLPRQPTLQNLGSAVKSLPERGRAIEQAVLKQEAEQLKLAAAAASLKE